MRTFLIVLFSIFGWTKTTWAQFDLSVDSITKQNRNVKIRVRNLGKRPTPPTKLSVWFKNNDNLFALENQLADVPTIEVGANKTFEFRYPDRKDMRHLLVTAKVDPATRIPESNERNNLLQKVFQLIASSPPIPSKPKPKLPDLKISSITKQGNKFVVKIINYGDIQSKPCILGTWAVDKETLKVTKVERYVPALRIGGTHEAVVDRIPKAKGNLTITSVIDSREKIAERIETNNRLQITFASARPVNATADLIVSRIDFKSPLEIEVAIRNQGSGTTGGPCKVRLEVIDRATNRRLYTTAKQLPQLAANQKHILKFESNVRLKRPAMAVQIMPDVDKVIRETNERNNATFQVY